MSGKVRTATSARMFVAVPIPIEVKKKLRQAVKAYEDRIKRVVPEENWHLTLLFLGDVPDYQQTTKALAADIPQSFVPTVTITHVGLGRARGQLWAFVQETPGLTNLRSAVLRRVEEPESAARRFVPHIRLATLETAFQDAALADFALSESFAVQQIHVYRSELSARGAQYYVEGTINLT